MQNEAIYFKDFQSSPFHICSGLIIMHQLPFKLFEIGLFLQVFSAKDKTNHNISPLERQSNARIASPVWVRNENKYRINMWNVNDGDDDVDDSFMILTW